MYTSRDRGWIVVASVLALETVGSMNFVLFTTLWDDASNFIFLLFPCSCVQQTKTEHWGKVYMSTLCAHVLYWHYYIRCLNGNCSSTMPWYLCCLLCLFPISLVTCTKSVDIILHKDTIVTIVYLLGISLWTLAWSLLLGILSFLLHHGVRKYFNPFLRHYLC